MSLPIETAVPTTKAGKVPMRTCIGCRKKAVARTMLRVVAVDGILTPDPRCRLPGRGAWLHPQMGCLDAAERRRGFGRALRLAGTPGGTADAVALDTAGVRSLLTSKAGRPVVSTP